MSQDLSASPIGNLSLGGEIPVCRMGYGAMRITGDGIWGPPKDRTAALRVLRRAVELGMNFIDTADSYGPGVSEELIAEALRPYPANLVVATKGGWTRHGPNVWAHNASPDHLREAINGSLRRLKLERIDLYQLHIPDPLIPFEQSVEALAEMREQGKIRLIGLSNVTVEHIERAREIAPIASVQNRYSFSDQEWDHVVDYCEQKAIAFIPWFPLQAGAGAGDLLKKTAEAHRATHFQIALAWLLQRSPIMLPIPGTTSVQHLEENMLAGCIKLTDQERRDLVRESPPFRPRR